MLEAESRPTRADDCDALRPLGTVASAYLALLAAIATLAPFELAWPERFALDFHLRADDLVLNLLMLLPLGFVCGLGARDRERSGRRGLHLGLVLSLCFELVQLFLRVRRANPFDVVANSAGAWLGAWLYAWLRPWVDARVLSVLRARPPLAALPFALLPAFWLDDLALYTPARGILVALLGVAGARAAAGSWSQPALRVRIALWYLAGALPALLLSPASRISTIAAGLLCSLLAATPPRRARWSVARALPWLGAYLLAVALWSPPLRHAPRWTFGFVPFDRAPLSTMLAFLEYVAAFTLLGYLHALLARPRAGARRARLPRITAYAFALACGLELVRAAVFGGCASGTAIALLVVAAISGACLHDAQREAVHERTPAAHGGLTGPAPA